MSKKEVVFAITGVIFAIIILLAIAFVVGNTMAILFGVTTAGDLDKIVIGLVLMFLFSLASGGK